LAYDATGKVVATLDFMARRGDTGEIVGWIDFAKHEVSGGEHTDIWNVGNAEGSKVWPEWLGSRAHDFQVELEGPDGQKRLAALVHPSGHRRERAAIDAAIAERIEAAGDAPADIRDLVGGPDRPLILDDEGRTVGRSQAGGTPAHLPVMGRGSEGRSPNEVVGIGPQAISVDGEPQ